VSELEESLIRVKITSTRIATEADAKAIAEIANEHELSVDSKSTLFSEQAALDFITGYIDPSVTYLLGIDEEPGFSIVVNLHPDSVKRKYFTDIYAHPRLENLEDVVLWAIELAQSENPDWEMWPGANFLDQRLQRAFGFVPRELERWRELVIEDVFLDHSGVFVAFINDQPVGFCQCTDEYAEENKGYISILGVALEYQGLGVGEALLQTGISHSATKGYGSLELNVDTGNETGALKLYEKVGLKPESSWIQLHRPHHCNS